MHVVVAHRRGHEAGHQGLALTMKAIDADALGVRGGEIALDLVGRFERAVDGQLQAVVELAEVRVERGLAEVMPWDESSDSDPEAQNEPGKAGPHPGLGDRNTAA